MLSFCFATSEPMQLARSGKRALAICRAPSPFAADAALSASWFSKAQAMTSGARSPAHRTASLTAQAPGCVRSDTIQLHSLSSGKSSATRSISLSSPLDTSRRSNARQAGHSGSKTSIAGAPPVCLSIGTMTP